MKTYEIIQLLETLAPISLQESYDNAGLIVGDINNNIDKVLISLDVTEAVIEEAIQKKCDMVIAHHPIIFGGLKKLNGKNYVERTVIKAIQNNISIYAIHTNLDNVLSNGVNNKIAEKLGLRNTSILRKREGDLLKLVTFVPLDHIENVREAIFSAGAGSLGNYDKCSFVSTGEGSFRGNENSNAYVGEKGVEHREKEQRIEVVVPKWHLNKVLESLHKSHPYEEVAYDVYQLLNVSHQTGAGLISEFEEPMSQENFLARIKNSMKASVIKYTKTNKDIIKKVAVCGGAGSFLIADAKRAGADAYITGDIKYHEFFDGENDLMICDIGHYESEQFTIDLLGGFLLEKIPNFAVIFTEVVTNPVKYYH